MSTMTRVAATLVGITIAAIPVAALTIKNTSDKEVSIGVDTGPTEAVYKIPAGTSVDVKESCADGCAVTGPWGFSRFVSENDTIETDGKSLVTDLAATPAAPTLLPENPIEAAATPEATAGDTASAAKTAAPSVEKPAPRRRVVRKPAPQQAAAKPAKKGPAPGSFGILFFGPGK